MSRHQHPTHGVDHEAPPHFRVIYKDREVDARFGREWRENAALEDICNWERPFDFSLVNI